MPPPAIDSASLYGILVTYRRANMLEETLQSLDHRIANRASPLALSRVRVNAGDELEVFKARVSGVHPSIHRVLRRP